MGGRRPDVDAAPLLQVEEHRRLREAHRVAAERFLVDAVAARHPGADAVARHLEQRHAPEAVRQEPEHQAPHFLAVVGQREPPRPAPRRPGPGAAAPARRRRGWSPELPAAGARPAPATALRRVTATFCATGRSRAGAAAAGGGDVAAAGGRCVRRGGRTQREGRFQVRSDSAPGPSVGRFPRHRRRFWRDPPLPAASVASQLLPVAAPQPQPAAFLCRLGRGGSD